MVGCGEGDVEEEELSEFSVVGIASPAAEPQSCLPLLLRTYCPDLPCFQKLSMAAGAYTNNLLTEEQRMDVVRNACPGAGACGGMYTANTMASAIEALGMSLPYSSSIPATDPLKRMECVQAGQ